MFYQHTKIHGEKISVEVWVKKMMFQKGSFLMHFRTSIFFRSPRMVFHNKTLHDGKTFNNVCDKKFSIIWLFFFSRTALSASRSHSIQLINKIWLSTEETEPMASCYDKLGVERARRLYTKWFPSEPCRMTFAFQMQAPCVMSSWPLTYTCRCHSFYRDKSQLDNPSIHRLHGLIRQRWQWRPASHAHGLIFFQRLPWHVMKLYDIARWYVIVQSTTWYYMHHT